jgi:nucleotide-binding universal stress UspA family protein
LTTPLLHWIYPARMLEAEAAGKAPEAARPFTILVPIAAPRSAGPLLSIAGMLSGEEKNRRIYTLHLQRPVDRAEFRSGLRESQQAAVDEAMRTMLSHAQAHQIPVEPITFVSRDVARDISRVARDRHADLVLIGFHKPVFGRSILGGTVHRVLVTVPTDVAVFVDRGFVGAQRVLVPYLGGRHDRLAMQLAGQFARNAKAQVTVLHVTPPHRGEPPLNAKEAVDRGFNDPTQPLPVQMRVMESADPVGTVIEQSRDFDLVVIGVAEEWGLASHLFGWRPERIAEGTPTSLLIARQYVRPEAPGGGTLPVDRDIELAAQTAGSD